MANWLTLSSFDNRIVLPRSFDLNVLTPYLTETLEGWLPRLIGAKRVLELKVWLDSNPFGTDSNPLVPTGPDADLFVLVERFLVYACWSQYVLRGSLQAGTTGLVIKKTDNTDQPSDALRAESFRAYKGLAEDKANDILTLINQNAAACTDTTGGGGTIRISSSSGRTTSLF